MKIELIQPFINAADAVLAEMLQSPAEVRDVTMAVEVYRRRGVAASMTFRGDIEGYVILDLETKTALEVARALAGEEVHPLEQAASETVCELANMVVGNAVTLLNDRGYRFKVSPPEVHTADEGYACSSQREALVMCFQTSSGRITLNIALDYSRQRTSLVSEELG